MDVHTIASIPVGTVFRAGKLIMQKITDDIITAPIKDSRPNVINLVNGHRCTMLTSLSVIPLGAEYQVPSTPEPTPLKPLPIQRILNEETREQEVLISGAVFSMHRTQNEVLVTDTHDYTKIYQITSRTFFDRLDGDND